MLSNNKNKISNLLNSIKSARSNLMGFTLVELLASIFILVLVSGVFMVNYHNTSKRSELKTAVQKLASDIRLAQNYSLGSKTYDGVNTPKGGWGAHFSLASPSSYIIFADKNAPNGNRSFDIGEAIETRTLPAGVTINSLSPANALDIIFFPPDPVTYVNGSDNSAARVELKENINNSTAAAVVNFFGLIDVE